MVVGSKAVVDPRKIMNLRILYTKHNPDIVSVAWHNDNDGRKDGRTSVARTTNHS